MSLHDDLDALRVTTARLKFWRLKLPPLGSLMRVRKFAVLTLVGPYAPRGAAAIKNYEKGDLVLLVYMDMNPPLHPDAKITDPVQAFFMGKGGAIVSTGARGAADIFTAYDVL